MTRRKPMPKAFRQLQKEVKDAVDYQLKDFDFWPKMLRRRLRDIQGLLKDDFEGDISLADVKKVQQLREDLNKMSDQLLKSHSSLGVLFDDLGKTGKISMETWRNEQWKIAAKKSFDIVDLNTGEVFGEAVEERAAKAWLRQNKLDVVRTQEASGQAATLYVNIPPSRSVTEMPGRGGKGHQRSRGRHQRRVPTKDDMEDLRDKIEARLSPAKYLQYLKRVEKRLDEELTHGESATKRDIDWEAHAKDFVGDFEHDLKAGADPAGYMSDLAAAMKEGDFEGELKGLTKSSIADSLYDAVLKVMKKRGIA